MEKGTEEDAQNSTAATPFSAEAIITQSAQDAYNLVLKYTGAVLPKRDTLDERIVNDVKNRAGHMIDVQGEVILMAQITVSLLMRGLH